MAQRRARSFTTRSSRPNRSWAAATPAAVTSVPANSKVLLGSFTLSNANIDETILRTVGLISVGPDQLVASEDQVGAFGLIAVTDRALAAGAASIPGPFTDGADDGWFVYVPFAQSLIFADATGLYPEWATQYMFDSKAKRRFQEGQAIAIMAENGSATAGFQIHEVFRMLSMVSGT